MIVKLSKFDDETIINVTLIEMLRHDFQKEIQGLDPLPTDDSGIDVKKVFQIIRQDIKDTKGWELKEEVWLAQFSFNKFLLWKDLNSHFDKISENQIVKSIYEKCATDNISKASFVGEKSLDEEISFDKLYCPLSYDSSQLSAIISAQKGRSFVLYGPPGTGKSQTISNLIANSLANGQRVLFVAEKRVALEVVYKRLNSMGLGKFCLELHSNKSGKAEVISQFKEVLNITSSSRDNTWETLATSLERLRSELNGYVKNLHKRYPNKLSAYSCYSYLIKNASIEKNEAFELFDKYDALSQNIDELDLMRDTCKKLGISMRGISESEIMDMRFMGNSMWSPQWESKLAETVKSLDSVAKIFEKAFTDALQYFDIPKSKASEDFIQIFMEYMSLLRNAPTLPEDFILGNDWNDFEKQARKLAEVGMQRNSSRIKLTDFELQKIESIDFEGLKNYIAANKNSLFGRIKNWFKLDIVRKARKNNETKWNSELFSAICDAAIAYKTAQENINSFTQAAEKKLGSLWNSGEIDWTYLLQILDYGNLLRKDCRLLAGEDLDGNVKIRTKLGKILASANELLKNDCILYGKINSLIEKYEALQQARKNFASLAKIRREYLPDTNDIFQRIASVLDSVERNKSVLDKWCVFQGVFEKAVELKLQPVLNAIYQGKLTCDNVYEIFEAKYRKAFINELMNEVPELRNFESDIFESEIREFDDRDTKYQNLTKDIICARLTQQAISFDKSNAKIKEEFASITHEAAKQRAYKPVRKILSEIHSKKGIRLL